jgi:hypothetical protein
MIIMFCLLMYTCVLCVSTVLLLNCSLSALSQRACMTWHCVGMQLSLQNAWESIPCRRPRAVAVQQAALDQLSEIMHAW